MQTASESKTLPSSVKEISERTVTGIVAAFGNVDDGADIIHEGAFKKTIKENGGRNRVRHLWQHDFTQPPIATIKELREVGIDEIPSEIRRKYPEVKGGLLVKRTYLETPRGDEVLAGLRSGALTEMSFGYDPIKYDFNELEDGDLKGLVIRNLRELRLWDTSDVNWGMNPATSGSKSVVPFKSAGVVEPNIVFIVMRNEIEDWHYALVDDDRKLFLHHHGHGKANWLAVRDSMSDLLEAKHDLTVLEQRGVYNHLKSHYEEYGNPVPSFKLVELAYTLQQAKRLTQDDEKLQIVADSITSIQRQLRAEPSKTLTPDYRRRLDLLSRQIDLAMED